MLELWRFNQFLKTQRPKKIIERPLQIPTKNTHKCPAKNCPKQEQPHKHGYHGEEATPPRFVCLDGFFDDWWVFGHAGIVTV
jgi:hypothetical protein